METGRERVLKAISHIEPGTTPVNISNIYGLDRWLKHFGARDGLDLRDRLDLDIEYARPVYTGKYSGQGLDIWGTPLGDVFGAEGAGYSGARGGYPLADARTVEDIERFEWPDPDDFDYDVSARVLRSVSPTKARRIDLKYGISAEGRTNEQCQSGGSWLPLICALFNLFGFERTLMNLALEPLLMEAAIRRIEEFTLEFTRRSLEATRGLADVLFYGDDFSSQKGLLISPEQWRRFLKPTYEKVFALGRSHGVKNWFHSCGQFTPVLGDLVDIGMDVWETVQVHLQGNDPRRLKREFGKHLAFFGAVSTQTTLPNGTPDEVRAEVRERVRVLGEGGGYICGADHGIMPDVPIENVVAMLDEARRFKP
jgi:uroporphyrinogen decarboxylase